MTTIEFFLRFMSKVKESPNWAMMEKTVEDSPWHREKNVAVHTQMTINQYLKQFFQDRTERQRMLTLMALLFHDFGKPEAEETLEKKDEPGVFYRRYAGHEPISGNVFMSFMIENTELREMFFAQGCHWSDLRRIKVMIEHHLPYGLKNVQKRQNLAHMLYKTLSNDLICYYDMLRSDAAGRISDNHEEKLNNVETWINEFQTVSWKPHNSLDSMAPQLVLLVGISGSGKSTYINEAKQRGNNWEVFSEDQLRLDYFKKMNPAAVELEPIAEYNRAWHYCHMDKESKYEEYAKAVFAGLLLKRKCIFLDRMNQSRKGRQKYIEVARKQGYRIRSIEFMVSEDELNKRQTTRGDKYLPPARVHQLYMQMETPWLGPEIDEFSIYIP